MYVSVTKLRANLFRLIDQVLETGAPLEIERHGKIVVLAPRSAPDRLSRLKAHPQAFDGDPDDVADIDWSSAWHADS